MHSQYDLLIRNALIIDGTRRPRFAGDIGVRVAAMSRLERAATPAETARGIDSVIVNGVPVWREGQSTGARPGRVLRAGAAAERAAVG